MMSTSSRNIVLCNHSKLTEGTLTVAANAATWMDFGAAIFALKTRYGLECFLHPIDPDAIIMGRDPHLKLVDDTATTFEFLVDTGQRRERVVVDRVDCAITTTCLTTPD